MKAVLFCHSNGIIHRDIKPDNILFDVKNDELTVVLADFGHAVRNNKGINSKCGTTGYVAPEMEQGSEYSFPVDMWSVGIVLHELLFGTLPTECSKKKRQKISGDAQELLDGLLQQTPQNRWTASKALTSDFFSKLNRKMYNF